MSAARFTTRAPEAPLSAYVPAITDLWDSDASRPAFDELHLATFVGPLVVDLYAKSDAGLNPWPPQEKIAVWDNGAPLGIYAVASAGTRIRLELGAGSHDLIIREGLNAYNLAGVRLTRVVAAQPVTPVPPVAPANRVVVLGDSIAAGFLCDNPPTEAWSQILKTTLAATRVTCHARGGWTLTQFASAPASIAALIAELTPAFDGTVTNTLWIALGYNDAAAQVSAAQWGTFLAALLDALHAALPALVVYVQSPITASVESFGAVTLAQYRQRAAEVCGTRGPWARHVNGANHIDAAPLVDGVHPGTAGNASYAASVLQYLSWNPFVAGVGVAYFDGYSWAAANWGDKFGVHPAPAVVQGALEAENPAYGGRDTVDLATAKYYQTAAFAEAQPLSFLLVGETADAAGAYLDAVTQFCLIGGVNGTDLGAFLGAAWLVAPGVDLTQKHCVVVVANGGATNIYVDSSAAPVASGNAGANGIAGGLMIGKRHTNADAWSSTAACVICWRGALDADVPDMMAWAAREFGAAWS